MAEPTEPELHSADVPQEDNLGDVRNTVQAIVDGLHDTQSIADRTKRSRRHVGYAINAAIVLGWIGEGDEGLSVLEPGKKLLAHAAGTPDERKAMREAIEKSTSVHALAPDLLAAAEPTRTAISERIQKLAHLSKSTSDRRAQTLLSWRRQILEG
jgi:hypothetical protein